MPNRVGVTGAHTSYGPSFPTGTCGGGVADGASGVYPGYVA
jgi:hypothetical protein